LLQYDRTRVAEACPCSAPRNRYNDETCFVAVLLVVAAVVVLLLVVVAVGTVAPALALTEARPWERQGLGAGGGDDERLRSRRREHLPLPLPLPAEHAEHDHEDAQCARANTRHQIDTHHGDSADTQQAREPCYSYCKRACEQRIVRATVRRRRR
jgi:hypothetical protein